MPSTLVSANADRYDQAAATYREGRLPYSPALLRHAVKLAKVTKESSVLDLGCGPGTIANEIAEYCCDVTAVDISQAMIDQGKAHAPENVHFIQGSSDDLSFIDRPLQLVTFGRSFHWMDREATLRELNEHVAPDGGLAFFYVAPLSGKTAEHQWYYAVRRAAKQISDLDMTNDSPISADAEREEFILMRSAFRQVSVYAHYERTTWTYERVLAWLLSRYSTNAGDVNKRIAKIDAALKKALAPFGDGPWTTVNQQRVVIARRPKKQREAMSAAALKKA